MRIILLLAALALAGVIAVYVVGLPIGGPGAPAPVPAQSSAAGAVPVVSDTPGKGDGAGRALPDPAAQVADQTAAQTEAAAEALTQAAATRAASEAAAEAAAAADARRLAALLDDAEARDAALSVAGFDAAVARAAIDRSALSGPDKLDLKRALEAATDEAALQAVLDRIKAAPRG